MAGRARRPGPGAGRALYRGRRLRQEAGGGEGGATQLPGEGGGSAPGGHGAQPAAALTPACAPPASRPGLGLRSALADRRHPPQLPSAPSPRELRRPKLGEKFPNFRQAGRGAPDPVPRLLAFPLAPHFGRRATAGPESSLELPCPPACPPSPVPRLARRTSRPVTCGRSPTGLPSPRWWQLLARAPPAPLPGADLCQGSAPASPARQLPFPSPRLSSPCAGRADPGR